jgi:parallel beta-helix repeat protein
MMRRIMLAACVLNAACAMAADYYVRPDGNDGATGTADAPGRAFRTIGKACRIAGPGDTVTVGDGTYSEDEVKIENKKGSPDRRLLLKAAHRHSAILQSTTRYHALTVMGSTGVTVDGLQVCIKEPEKHRLFGILVADSNHITIRNCYIHDVGSTGIQANSGEHYIVEDNIVRNVAWATGAPNGSGISFYHPRYVEDYKEGEWGILCRRNIVFDNYCPFKEFTEFPTDGNGIILDDFKNSQKHNKGGQEGGYFHPSLVENNLVFNNGGRGIHAFITDNVTIRHNTLYQNNHELARYLPYGWNGDLNINGDRNTVYNNVVVFRQGNPRGYAMLISGQGNAVRDNLVAGPVGLQQGDRNPVPGDLPEHNTVVPADAPERVGFACLPGWKLMAFPDSTRLTDRQFPFFADPIDSRNPQLERYFAPRPGSPMIDRVDAPEGTDDLLQRKRPSGTRADLGAIEAH